MLLDAADAVSLQVMEDHLVIFTYFFPHGGAKTVNFRDITDVEDATNFSIFKKKTWGMSFSTIWWACDWTRGLGRRGQVVVHVKGDWCAKGFACEDAPKVIRLIKNAMSA